MKRLYIVEGLPCSGKSTVSAFLAEELNKSYDVCFVDEGTGEHPADYEFHSFISESDLSSFGRTEQAEIISVSEKLYGGYIIPLKCFSGNMFDRLLPHKIYDFLPWETEKPIMLEKWESFAEYSVTNTVYVFNCVFLQNPMCETMMRFGFSQEKSKEYISRIAEIIKPLNPVIIYLKNNDIRSSVEKTSMEREGWLDAVIDYHINGAYGKSINAEGLQGYISCLQERQKRELDILSALDIESVVLDNPQRDWNSAYEDIRKLLF